MCAGLYNYNPGPAMLPAEVRQQISDALDGCSSAVPLLELGHRTPEFCQIAEQAEQDLRQLLDISSDYSILFLAGGATAQYAMVPMNLCADGSTMDYVDTGHWSKRAIEQARAYGTVNVISAATQHNELWELPSPSTWQHSKLATYCHFVDNETLTGFELPEDYINASCPLVSDMTSNFLSRKISLQKFGVIYAGAQKNIGIAGITVIIVRNDLLKGGNQHLPKWENYTMQVAVSSRYNTPPIFAWFVCGLVLAWTMRQGGVEEMARRCKERANHVYACIDNSTLYVNTVARQFRSRCNIHFQIRSPELEKRFIEQSEAQGLLGLRGHRVVGGIRASLYNAMPLEGAKTLVEFMREFERAA